MNNEFCRRKELTLAKDNDLVGMDKRLVDIDMPSKLLVVAICLCGLTAQGVTAETLEVSTVESQIPAQYLEVRKAIVSNKNAMNNLILTMSDEKSATIATGEMEILVNELEELALRVKGMTKLKGKLQLSFIEGAERGSEESSKKVSKSMAALQKNKAAFEMFIENGYFKNLPRMNKANAVLAEFFSTDEVVILINGKETDDEMNQAELKVKNVGAAILHKDWNSFSSIALGDGNSFIFQTKRAHDFLAESFQRVFVFRGDSRRGEFAGALQLQMNTGGRTNVLVYRGLNKEGGVKLLIFEDRFGKQSIDLEKILFVDESEGTIPNLEYLGLLSGEAYPNKFTSSIVLRESDARKKLK